MIQAQTRTGSHLCVQGVTKAVVSFSWPSAVEEVWHSSEWGPGGCDKKIFGEQQALLENVPTLETAAGGGPGAGAEQL